ncbi:MAG: murein L,D-transpeptidase [Acidimicrobiales bacterium]|nr:murein L,D-transpeptidase [Acidimicrobiales bacterium]
MRRKVHGANTTSRSRRALALLAGAAVACLGTVVITGTAVGVGLLAPARQSEVRQVSAVDGHVAPERSPAPATPLPEPEPEPEMDPEPVEYTDAPMELGPGDDGAEVLALQEALAALGYWSGVPDGRYGDLTAQAVLAFQKVEGLARTGIATTDVRERLANAERPAAVLPEASATPGIMVEVDLDRQVLLVVTDGVVEWAINTSTGAPATPTPVGSYRIFRDVDGTDGGPLGSLYRPKYFVGGYAIHGYPDVPGEAASHGCARVSDAAMDMLWGLPHLAIGGTVVVVGG